MKKIDISVVTYNSAHWLDNFFKSLMSQAYPLTLVNLIICDNESTDSTREKLRKFQTEHSDKFASFQLDEAKNIGFGVSHNNNIAQCYSDYVLVTNPDLEFERDSITTIVEAALSDNESVASWELRQKPYEHPKIYNPITLETEWSSAACILYRRSAFETVGGFEPRIFLYAEDVELSFRFRSAGYRLKYLPRAVCWHYSYKAPKELKPQQFFGSVLSNMYIRMRYGSLISIIIGLMLYIRLFFQSMPVPSKNLTLLKNLCKVFINAPYFLKKRAVKIPFTALSFDYSQGRDGAFYELKKISVTPLVSIIVRTHAERQEFLKQAVTSIVNQTYPRIELIIVEDGSDINKEYVDSIKSKLYKVVYVSIEKSGRCVAGNKGLELATGDYIGFLDDDDLLYADHVETLANELVANRKYAAAYSNAFEVSTEIKSLFPLIYKETNYQLAHQEPFSRARMWLSNYIPIQAIIFSRSLYKDYGGFDIELDCLEDWNLWTRYSLKDDFLYVPKTTSLYRIPANKIAKIERHKAIEKYKEIAVNKHRHMELNTLTPLDIKLYAEEMARLTRKASISRRILSRIKRDLVKLASRH